MALSGIIIPLTSLQASVDVDQLALRQELAADLRQPVPGHAGVVLGPLTVAATVLVGRDQEGRQRRSLPNDRGARPAL